METIGTLLLAAGESRRMGRPKQLLPWQQTTLLRHMATLACNANDGPVMVVLGHQAHACGRMLEDLPVRWCINPDWQQGMGSTIAHGTGVLAHAYPHLEAILIMLCDQVAVTPALLGRLIQQYHASRSDLILCDYGQATGPPALFSRRLFGELMTLKGAEGARSLWHKASSKTTLPFPGGMEDLDTPEQYASHSQILASAKDPRHIHPPLSGR